MFFEKTECLASNIYKSESLKCKLPKKDNVYIREFFFFFFWRVQGGLDPRSRLTSAFYPFYFFFCTRFRRFAATVLEQ